MIDLRNMAAGLAKPADRWLPRLSHLSQLGLLLLAAFGYYHTVLPLYSKALLEEQIAEKELRLKQVETRTAELEAKNRDAESKLADAQAALSKREALIAEQSARLASIANRLRTSESVLASTNRTLKQQSTELQAAHTEVGKTYEELRSRSLSGLSTMFSLACGRAILYERDEHFTEAIAAALLEKLAHCVEVRSVSDESIAALNQKDKAAIASAGTEAMVRFRVAMAPFITVAVSKDQTLAANLADLEKRYADDSARRATLSREEQYRLSNEHLSEQFKIEQALNANISVIHKQFLDVFSREASTVTHVFDKRVTQ